MSNPKIYIEGVDSAGKLKLSDRGKTEVDSSGDYRKITWKIRGASNPVSSIKLKPKTASAYPFDDPIPPEFDDEVKLKVTEDFREYDWVYSIVWKDQHGVEHEHDPIIAIRPSTLSPHLINKIIKTVLIALGIIGVSLLFSKRKRK